MSRECKILSFQCSFIAGIANIGLLNEKKRSKFEIKQVASLRQKGT
jgi:hypothetical protein